MPDNTCYPAAKTSEIGGVRYTRQEAVERLKKMGIPHDDHVIVAQAVARRFGGTTLEALSELKLR